MTTDQIFVFEPWQAFLIVSAVLFLFVTVFSICYILWMYVFEGLFHE